jgi:hypothetical protein
LGKKSQKMTSKTTEPVAILYIYRSNKRVVAIAIGHAPPDIAVSYDSLTRIPIMTNGNRPPWRTFTHYIGRESLGKALRRRCWSDQDQEQRPLPSRNRGKRRPSPPRRRSKLRKPQIEIGDVITWNGGKYKILAINDNGQVFARHTRTKEPINIKLEELKK